MQPDDGPADRPDRSDPSGHAGDPEPVTGGPTGPISDAAAWDSIVANFGDRAVLDPEDEPAARTREPAAPQPEAEPEQPADFDELMEREDRFVPPEPPPVPLPPPDRLAAWLGVFGSPTVLLVCLVLGVAIPSLLGWVLVAGFIGGFLYLVARTPGTPRDPWDDGSRV